MDNPLTPNYLDSLRKNGTLGGKALRLVEAETLAHLSIEIERLRALLLRMIPDNWREDRDALDALDHLARQGVPIALNLTSPGATPCVMSLGVQAGSCEIKTGDSGKMRPIKTLGGETLAFAQTNPSAPVSQASAPTIYELKDRTLRVLDRRTPKTSQQIAVELGSPDRVDLLAALGQLCAEGMAIREPGTGVYRASTNPCD
jgi:hypothetical protein